MSLYLFLSISLFLQFRVFYCIRWEKLQVRLAAVQKRREARLAEMTKRGIYQEFPSPHSSTRDEDKGVPLTVTCLWFRNGIVVFS